MNDGTSPLDTLRVVRKEFRTGVLDISHRLDQTSQYRQLAGTTLRFLHEVNNGLFKNSDMRLDMEALKLSKDTKAREFELRQQSQLSDSNTRERAELQLKNILPSEREEEYRQRIWSHLRKNHGYLLHIIDRLSPQAVSEGSNLPLSRQKEVIDTIVDQVVNFAARREGLPSVREPLEYNSIRKIISAVAGKTEKLADCRKIDINKGDPIRIIRVEEERLKGELEVEKQDLKQAMFAQREWRRETADRTAQGVKIYETPYYQSIFSRCDAVRDKQNGIGGKVFYGPPGTGKTEIAIHDAEVRNGFDKRVVSMHYWSSFQSLVYEASVKVAGGADKSLSYQERMIRGIGLFEGMNGEEFLSTIQGMVLKLGEQGKIGKDVSVAEFLKESVGDANIREIERAGSNAEKGEKLRDAVIGGLRQHAAAATFGHVMTEEDFWSEVVKGEVLQAIDRGQDRIILDEGEKAGPFAWAGLSRVLSMSPGETLDVAGRKIAIPSNLRVDVTVNSLQLDEYIRSRFNEINVGYPPPKDEMMISSVWLSDKEGNILLSEDEQYRLVGFFSYMLPEIRQLYDRGIIGQPFDLRVTHELCNLLVDPKTQRRTGYSLERALEMILYEQRGFAQFAAETSQLLPDAERKNQRIKKQKQAFDELKSIFGRYRQLVEAPAPFAGEEDRMIEAEMTKRQTEDVRKLREELLKRGLEATVSSPLAAATLLLPDSIPSVRNVDKVSITEEKHLDSISLGASQIGKIRDQIGRARAIEKEEAEEKADNITYATDIGFHMEIADNGASLRLLSLNSTGKSQELLDVTTPKNTVLREILDATPDGRFALVRVMEYENEEHNRGNNKVMIIACWKKENNTDAFNSVKLEKDIEQDAEIKLLAGGNGMVVFDKKGHTFNIQILDTEDMIFKSREHSYNGRVEDVQLSQDGSVMLITGQCEETYFVDIQQMMLRDQNRSIRPTERLEGKNWHIVGNRLIYNPDTNQTYYIATEPNAKTKDFIR